MTKKQQITSQLNFHKTKQQNTSLKIQGHGKKLNKTQLDFIHQPSKKILANKNKSNVQNKNKPKNRWDKTSILSILYILKIVKSKFEIKIKKQTKKRIWFSSSTVVQKPTYCQLMLGYFIKQEEGKGYARKKLEQPLEDFSLSLVADIWKEEERFEKI